MTTAQNVICVAVALPVTTILVIATAGYYYALKEEMASVVTTKREFLVALLPFGTWLIDLKHYWDGLG